MVAVASVGGELPLARCAPRRRLSASRVNRRFLGIEERSFPFLSTRRSAVLRNRLMLHQIPGVDDFFRGIRGGIWRDMAGYREIPGDTRRYTWISAELREWLAGSGI